MAFYTYILRSTNSGKLYIGHTSDIRDRLFRHNNNNENLSTKGRGPWDLIFSFEFPTRSEAIHMEKKLKSWKSSKRVIDWIARNTEQSD